MLVNLFGFMEEDVVGRLIVVHDGQSVANLAAQLQAWGPDLHPHPIQDPRITNEQGTVLDPSCSISEAGLTPGDIFHVSRDRR